MCASRVFVSHSHQDNRLVEPFVKDLKAAGVLVWVDFSEITHGDFIQRMNEGLTQCDWLVLAVTPHSLDSKFVEMEVNAAINQYGTQRVIPFVMAPFALDMMNKRPIWANLHRYNALKDGYQAAFQGLLRALGVTLTLVTPEPLPMIRAVSSPEPLAPIVKSNFLPNTTRKVNKRRAADIGAIIGTIFGGYIGGSIGGYASLNYDKNSVFFFIVGSILMGIIVGSIIGFINKVSNSMGTTIRISTIIGALIGGFIGIAINNKAHNEYHLEVFVGVLGSDFIVIILCLLTGTSVSIIIGTLIAYALKRLRTSN